MFKSMSDKEFCAIVHAILSGNSVKDICIKKELEGYFGRSFSSISQRYRRCMRLSIFAAHDRIVAAKAKRMLKKRQCCEVQYDLGFKNESYFSRWFRKHTGTNPGDYRSQKI
ncbi:MAG: AraC family transcriptional regulator [Candidatus Delongbacteria bacterium]|nr:AraC family transcriptional regulator [Candidatus Delongbacteria bacterium]